MSDDDEEYKRRISLTKPKCKLCKKKERVQPSKEIVERMIERLNRRAQHAASLTRDEIVRLRLQRDHVKKLQAGDYCDKCAEKTVIWIE
jgi:ATP/maltotriose-dependent transcriptional regulator MalT